MIRSLLLAASLGTATSAQTRIGENVGDTPTHVLIVESKPGASANPACSAP